jgi:hypothetical protein
MNTIEHKYEILRFWLIVTASVLLINIIWAVLSVSVYIPRLNTTHKDGIINSSRIDSNRSFIEHDREDTKVKYDSIIKSLKVLK